jgi:hypothetical protein
VTPAATFLARLIWAAMLWFMRRRWMRRFQRWAIRLSPEGPKRDKAWAGFRRQERWARRHGLRLLTGVVSVCLYAVLLNLIAGLVVWGMQSGWIPGAGGEE